jgi:PAS domain S-box-containing protein
MERYREELTRIRNLLHGHPRGLTVTEIARRIGVNRNSVAKYLDVLITSGHVEKKAVGPAKVYFLSPRVPVSALLNLSSDYIIMLDDKRKIWHVNNSVLSFEGRSREEVLGRDLDDAHLMLLMDPEIRNRLSREPSKGEFSTEVDVKKGEEIHHFRATLVCTILEDGSRGTTVILQDITEEKRSAESLRASEARYRAVVESQTEFVCRFLPDGTHVFVNDAYCRYFEKKRDEIEGHVFKPEIPDEDRETLRRHFDGLTPDHPVDSIEHRIVMPDGSIRWQRWIDRAIFDEDGSLAEYQSVGRDTTEHRRAEERLSESEEKFRGLAERSFDLIFLFDEEGRITYISPSVQKLAGVPPERFIGTSFREYIIAEDLPRAVQVYERSRQGLSTESFLVRVKKPDGNIVTLETNAIPIMREGKFTGVQVVSHDITGRLQMEKALRESEEKFRNIAERSFDIIFLFDGEGRIIYTNPAIRESMGYDPKEVIGKPYHEFIPAGEESLVARSFDRNRKGIPTQDLKLDVKRKNGSLATLEINATPIMEGGNFRGLQAVCRDITARVHNETALRESEEKFRSIAERAFDIILVTDGEGRITYVSPSLRQSTGYDPEEVTGRPIFDFVDAPDRSRATHAFERVRQGLPPQGLEIGVKRKDGTLATLEIRTTPIWKEERFTGVQVICRDITPLRRAELALRHSEEQFREMAEISPFPVAIIDEAGKYWYINRRFTEVFGYTLDDVPDGRRWFELAYPDPVDRSRAVSAWKADLAAFGVGMVRPRQFRVHCRNGECREILFRPVTMRDGSQFVTYQDLTEQIHNLETLTQSETLYRHLFNTMRCCFTLVEPVLDPSGRPVDLTFIEVNTALERLTGRPREALLGKRLQEIYPRTPEELIQTIGAVAVTGKARKLTIYHPDLDRHLSIRAYSPTTGQCALIFRSKITPETRPGLPIPLPPEEREKHHDS